MIIDGYEEIRDEKNNLLAFVIRNNFKGAKYNFPTEKNNPLQVGVNFYNKGDIVKAHYHNDHKRVIEKTQEFVFVASGKVKFIVYTNNGELVNEVTLITGEAILFVEGGHKWEMMEKTKIIEIKQGPYISVEEDKTYIE